MSGGVPVKRQLSRKTENLTIVRFGVFSERNQKENTMQTEALKLAMQTASASQPERLSWGVVEIQVTDLERTVQFWTSVLGLSVREQTREWAALGTSAKTLFVFHAGASRPAANGYLGMYHVAIGMPSQSEFSRLLARLMSMQIQISPVDHLMSKAIYLHDPDGLEIEIAFETPERFDRFGDMSRGLVLFDSEGRPHSGRERLPVDEELSYAHGADLQAALPDDAFLAHMHFKVSDLESAASWFEGLGFARNLMLTNMGLADMGAGGSYTHRVAMNTWNGRDLDPTPTDMARLTRYELLLNDPAVLINADALQPSSKGFTGLDPSGVEMVLNFNY
ncbi:MAG: VOC family protein [Granulosicoccus sp.]